MSRSSIFSFSTLQGFPKPSLPAVLSILFLIIASQLLRQQGNVFDPVPETRREFFNAQPHLNYDAFMPRPKVLIIGSSRLIFMKHKPIMEATNLPINDIQIMAWAGSSFYDAERYLNRYPDLLSQCEYIVLDMIPMKLFTTVAFPEDDSGVLRHMDWDQIPLLSTPEYQLKAYADHVIPFVSGRHRVDDWLRLNSLITSTPQERLELYRTGASKPKIPRIKNVDPEKLQFYIDAVLESQFPDTPLLSIQDDALQRIVKMLPVQSKLILIQPPFREDATKLIQEEDSYSSSNRRFRKYIDQFQSEKVQIVWPEDFGDIEFNEFDFSRDGAHMTAEGLGKVSTFIGQLLAEIKGK